MCLYVCYEVQLSQTDDNEMVENGYDGRGSLACGRLKW